MKLLRLILHGFKSFADRTEISFAGGITMIVGPNGCGKSNISDAVRWVLGEQNVRNLRGQKAEDIIFAGSASRKAKNGAEVTMVLDNTARELPLDTAEVSVTRRVLRSGDSEFFINQRACRLKDIQELFAATGLGKGSLAIIGQNRVDQVLSARPEERRLIFEEVAGISRYRMRKEEGLGKLRRTAENMDRVRDLTAVLEEQLGPMAEAAEKAKVFRGLIEEKRAAEATASLLKLSAARRMLARYETECRTLSDEKAEWAAKLAGAEAEGAALAEKAAALTEESRRAAETAGLRQREMDRIDGDYRVKETMRAHAEAECRRLEESSAGRAAALKRLKTELDEAETRRETAEAGLRRAEEALHAAEEEKTHAEAALAGAEESHRRLIDEIREKTARRDSAEQALLRLREEEERLASETARLEEEKKAAEERAGSADSALAALFSEEEERTRRMAELEEQGRQKKEKMKAGEARSFSLLNAWNEARAGAAQAEGERRYLEKADKEHASFSNASRTVLHADEPWQAHILGPLGELIRVPDAYTDAAEAVLGGTVSYIVTDTAEAAGEIIRWMKARGAGRTTFYPIDAMHPRFSDAAEREASREKGIRGIAADLFSCGREIEDLKKALLGRVLIAEDLDTARKVAKKYKYRMTIVTMDGQLIRPGGAMTGGSMRKKANTFFGRKQEIEALREKAAAAEKEARRLAEEKQSQDEENARLSDALSAAREAWQAENAEAAAAKVKKENFLRMREEARAEAEKAGEALKITAEKQASCGEEKRAVEEKLKTLRSIPEMPEEEKIRPLRERAEAAAAGLTEASVAAARAEEAFRRAAEIGEEKRAALAAEEDRGTREAEELTGKREEEAALAEAMKGLADAFEQAKAAGRAAAEERDRLRDEADGLAAACGENEKRRRAAQDELMRLERKLAEREARAEEQKRQEREEINKLELSGFTEASAEAVRLEGNSQDMKDRLASLSEKLTALGPVNPNAEADYEMEKERLRAYENQLEDLKKAQDGLEKVIREIDTTMAAHFTEAFSRIDAEFGRIMQLMFPGGRGKLELTDRADPLECGVELYLDLPGKKRQPLSLMSGGERALTVIALLISFLAYRPAPFCFVDEIDAALDDANVERFSRMMREYKKRAQFIVITHRKKTMEYADTLQGVTMGEKGVSSLVTVRMEDYIKEE